MVAFDPIAGFGIIDNLQSGEPNQPYLRRVVMGGNAPYTIQVNNGAMPNGMAFEADPTNNAKSTRILKGTPTVAGIYSFGMTVTDSQGNTVSKPSNYILKIGNVAANTPPTADNLVATVNENSASTINFSGNDADGDAITYSINTPPLHGSVTNGVYTPAANYSGVDSFTYKAFDGKDYSIPATVNITVVPTNYPPVAINDSAIVNTNSGKVIKVKANDTDVDKDVLTVTGVSLPAHGKISININGDVVYRPALNYTCSDTFNYTISDGKGGTASAVVTVSVSTNHVPVAVADSATTLKNTAVIINVLANDSDSDNDVLTISGKSLITNSAVTINANKTITFKPTKDFVGIGGFSYTISDGRGKKSTAPVTISIQ